LNNIIQLLLNYYTMKILLILLLLQCTCTILFGKLILLTPHGSLRGSNKMLNTIHNMHLQKSKSLLLKHGHLKHKLGRKPISKIKGTLRSHLLRSAYH